MYMSVYMSHIYMGVLSYIWVCPWRGAPSFGPSEAGNDRDNEEHDTRVQDTRVKNTDEGMHLYVVNHDIRTPIHQHATTKYSTPIYQLTKACTCVRKIGLEEGSY